MHLLLAAQNMLRCIEKLNNGDSKIRIVFSFRTSVFTAVKSELPRPIPCNQTSNEHRGVYFDSVTLTSYNVMLTSQKPCQYNDKFDCSETNGYNNQQDAINEA